MLDNQSYKSSTVQSATKPSVESSMNQGPTDGMRISKANPFVTGSPISNLFTQQGQADHVTKGIRNGNGLELSYNTKLSVIEKEATDTLGSSQVLPTNEELSATSGTVGNTATGTMVVQQNLGLDKHSSHSPEMTRSATVSHKTGRKHEKLISNAGTQAGSVSNAVTFYDVTQMDNVCKTVNTTGTTENKTKTDDPKYSWENTLEEVPPPRRVEDSPNWFHDGGVSTTSAPDNIEELLKPPKRPTPRPKPKDIVFIPEPMDGDWQLGNDVAQISSSLPNIIILIGIFVCILIVFRTRTAEGILISYLAISLCTAHCVTMFFREPRLMKYLPKDCCLVAGLVYQYSYLSVHICLLLCSLQVVCIYGKFNPGGWILNPVLNFWLAYSLPMFPTLITFFYMPTSYTTDWTCIGNLGTNMSVALFLPTIMLSMAAFIVSEAGAIFNRDNPHLLVYDEKSMTRNGFLKAFLSAGCPVITADYLFTTGAVYTQQIPMFTAVFALNITTIIVFVFFCIPIEDQVRAFAERIWNYMRQRVASVWNFMRQPVYGRQNNPEENNQEND